MLNFVLCDDNVSFLNRLSKILDTIFIKHNFQAKIGFTSDDANKILKYVEENSTDVLILDINLKSNMSGLELAKAVRKFNKHLYIIFTTGHLEFSLLAYQVKTFDYLPKPVTLERLESTICRLFEDINHSPKRFIHVNPNTLVDPNDIEYIKKDGMKLVFYTKTKTYETYNSFSKIEPCLPDNFIRCHKSYIANIDNIKNIESNTNKIIFDHNQCYIGPKYKNKFMEVFNYGNFSNHLDGFEHA